jgi:hypothetical protein
MLSKVSKSWVRRLTRQRFQIHNASILQSTFGPQFLFGTEGNMAKSMLALALVGVSAILSSCGASSPTLQSITINRQVERFFPVHRNRNLQQWQAGNTFGSKLGEYGSANYDHNAAAL